MERSRPIRTRVRLWLRKRAQFERRRAERTILREHVAFRERRARVHAVLAGAWQKAQMEPIVEIVLVGMRWQGREALYHDDAARFMERDARLIDALDGLPGESIEVALARARHARVVWTNDPASPSPARWGELRDQYIPPRFILDRRPPFKDKYKNAMDKDLWDLVNRTYRIEETLPEQARAALDRQNEQDGRWWLDEDEYPVRALAAFERGLPAGYTVDGLHVGHP